MTRHERCIAQYPARIHRKRLKRHHRAYESRVQRRADVARLRNVLREYVATRPKPQPIRVGRKTITSHIKDMFRKPTL